MEGPSLGRVVNYDLESVVEADHEVAQVSVKRLGVHVGTDAILVAAPTVGGGEVGLATEQVDIEIHGNVLVERVVQTRNHIDAEGGVVVTIVGGNTTNSVVSRTLQMETEIQLCLGKNGEVFPVGNVVAEIGGKYDGRLASKGNGRIRS